MLKKIIITIDGPAGSGKSTSAKYVAQRLGFTYLDTGAMYRAITYSAIEKNIIEDESAIIRLAESAELKLQFTDGKTRVSLNGVDVTEKIRSHEVNSVVSYVSKIAEVRSALVRIQQSIGNDVSIVAEGRDTGTVVFPQADVKIFLTAKLNERVKRRLLEFREKGQDISLEEIETNIASRDRIDSGRQVSPLVKAEDAIEIDTSNITIEQEVDIILEKIYETAGKKGLLNSIIPEQGQEKKKIE